MIFGRNRFLFLLISLSFAALLNPVLEGLELVKARALSSIFLSAILLFGVSAVSRTKSLFAVALSLGVPALSLNLAVNLFDSSRLLSVSHAFVAVYLIFITGIILSHVLKDERVTSEKISAALCVYLLIGMIWAFLFSVTFYLQPRSFRLESGELSEFIYYSFVTLSTLGYGDITPATPAARALSYVEAISGQIYLAVLVARLVSLHIIHSERSAGE